MAIQNKPQFYINFKNYLSATKTHVIVWEGLPIKVMIALSMGSSFENPIVLLNGSFINQSNTRTSFVLKTETHFKKIFIEHLFLVAARKAVSSCSFSYIMKSIQLTKSIISYMKSLSNRNQFLVNWTKNQLFPWLPH